MIIFRTKINALNEAYNSGKPYAVDKANRELFEFMDTILAEDDENYIRIRNFSWQKNHLKVLASISTLMQELGRMPATSEISNYCNLSEETIYKHLREFKDHDLYKHETDKYRLMIHRVLTEVFKLSLQGDVRACKIYLDYFKESVQDKVPALEQTNYIQINSVRITPDELENLPFETLKQIENIIMMPVTAIKEKQRLTRAKQRITF